jgi:hypothetical protein
MVIKQDYYFRKLAMQSFGGKKIVITVILFMLISVSAIGTAGAQGNKPGPSYSFVYLGDIHFDRRSHHDFEWVKAEKPNDIRQIDGKIHPRASDANPDIYRIQQRPDKDDCSGWRSYRGIMRQP